MSTINKKLGTTKNMVLAAVAAVLSIGGAAYPLAVHALDNGSDGSRHSEHTQMVRGSEDGMHKYVAIVRPLNHTGVSGIATFTTEGRILKVNIHATGVTPGVHPQHIHGKDQAKAECPTHAADTNGDGFTSVIEGAPSYGLIKMSLTNPQTTFGTPVTPLLFEPFAGKANNANFPVVGKDGVLSFSHTYTFDNSEAAQAALTSLTPFGDQELVIHGAVAPKSVDADAFAALGAPYPAGTDLTATAYDVLLPAGCGEIDEAMTKVPANNAGFEKLTALSTAQDSLAQGLSAAAGSGAGSQAFDSKVAALSAAFNSSLATAVATYQSSNGVSGNHDNARNQLINSLAAAKDAELNGLTEARNQLIDTLNQSGSVADRDTFLNGFNTTVDQYRNVLEQAKNQL